MELKKNPKLDLEKRRPLFFQIGMIASLVLVLIAFEWRHEIDKIDVVRHTDDPIEYELPLITAFPLPPVPKPLPELQVVKPNQPITFTSTLEEPTATAVSSAPAALDDIPVELPEPEPEDLDIPFFVSETMPSFPGGMDAFYEYLSTELKYPYRAKKDDVEGKVFLSFIIDKDGSVSEVVVLKGIGSGCDEEAVRVLKNSPKWNPGKQRGQPVRVRQALSIKFEFN